MNIKPTLTIGIAAYNEENNIYDLLNQLLHQQINPASLKQIIVVSDGSTDQTTDEIKRLNDKKIMLIHKKREGKGIALETICQKSQSDILVLLDADIVIKDKNFIDKLIDAIISNKADLTSGMIKELPTKSYFGTILATSMIFKKNLYSKIDHGDNIYTCHGRNTALSKKLYKKLSFSKYIADDAYSYLYAIKHGFRYTYVKGAQVYYHLPKTLSDHLKQSYRFLTTRKEFNKEFSTEFVNKSYSIPKLEFFISYLNFFLKKPTHLFAYSLIMIWSKISSLKMITHNEWTIAESSKK